MFKIEQIDRESQRLLGEIEINVSPSTVREHLGLKKKESLDAAFTLSLKQLVKFLSETLDDTEYVLSENWHYDPENEEWNPEEEDLDEFCHRRLSDKDKEPPFDADEPFSDAKPIDLIVPKLIPTICETLPDYLL